MGLRLFTAIVVKNDGSGAKYRNLNNKEKFIRFVVRNFTGFQKVVFYDKKTKALECVYTERFGFSYRRH